MLSPISFHRCLKTPVLPVKCNPAKSLSLNITSPASGPSTKIKLMTPSGSPASLKTSIIILAE